MNKKIIRNWSKYLGLIFALSVLTACSSNSIKFIDVEELPYEKDFNMCSLVSEINDQKIPSLLNDGQEINFDGLAVKCNSNNVALLENEALDIQFEMDSKVFTKTIRFVSDTAVNSVVEEIPQTEPTTEVTEGTSQNESTNEVVEESSQSDSTIESVNDDFNKPAETIKEPAQIEKPSGGQVGVHSEFRVSETVNQIDAQNACVQYIKQYTNFTGCSVMRDEQTQLIIGFKTQ